MYVPGRSSALASDITLLRYSILCLGAQMVITLQDKSLQLIVARDVDQVLPQTPIRIVWPPSPGGDFPSLKPYFAGISGAGFIATCYLLE